MASRKFLVPANLLNSTEDPSSSISGDIYFNTLLNKLRIYDGSVWNNVDSGSTIHVGEDEPLDPEIGFGWFNNVNGDFYIYDGVYWVQVNTVLENPPYNEEQVQDSAAELFTHSSHVNITASYDDINNKIILTGSSEVSGDLTNIDSIKYPDYISFDTTPETIPTATGSIYWDSGDGLPTTVLNSNVTIGLGQEQVALVKNATGASIAKGKAVYINGAQGQRPTITLSDADAESTSSKTFGLTAEAIADGAEGFVTTFGVLRGVNTLGLTQGSPLWLSSTAGGYTTIVPAEPAHSVFLGYVVKAHGTAGEIFVNIQNGYELTELHGVVIEADESLTDNEVLAYDITSGLWKNQTSVEAGLIDTSLTEQTKAGNLIIGGNLTVNGTTTTLNTENLIVEDNIITLNSNVTGSPTLNAGIEVERGTSDNVSLLWNETSDRWTLTGDGTNYYPIAVQNGWTYPGAITIKSDNTGEGNLSFQTFANSFSLSDVSGAVLITGAGTKVFTFTNSGSISFPDGSSQPTAFLGMSFYTTTSLTEGTNLYFTDERAQDAIGNSIGTGLSYNDSTGAISNSGVLDLTGTANEIVVSGSTGSITIGIPDSPVFVTPNIGVATATSINGTTIPTSKTLVVTTDIGSTVQGYDADLAAIAALTGTSGLLSTNGSGTWSVDTNTYSTTSHNHTVDSLSNVVITGTPTDGEALVWDTTTSKWINGDVSVDLSAYAPIVNPVFTSNIEVKGQLSFDVTGGTPGAFINFATIPGLYSSLDIISTDIIFFQSVGDMNISSQANVFINGTSGEYIGTASPNNQIATIGDLSSFLTSYTETSTLEDVTDRGATSSNAISITNTTPSTSTSTGALVISGGLGVGDSVWIEGDLHVAGTTITENTQTVATHDNMIYLNAAQDSVITNAVGDGTYVTYTADNDYTVGMDIRVTGMDPAGYNISSADGLTVFSATSTQFVVEKTTTGTFVSGGTAHAKTEANPDLGFAGGYYSGSYAHAGLFRDASDGVFKFFQGYTPEPDEAVNIDTTHVSFTFADIQIRNIKPQGSGQNDNFGLGYNATLNATGFANFGIGQNAFAGGSGTNNFAIGDNSLENNTGGSNFAFGVQALTNNTGSYNYGIGNQALQNNSGWDNYSIGPALYGNTGDWNYAIGYFALSENTGDYNSAFGYEAGVNNTGSYNVYIGKSSGLSTSNNIVIADNEGNLRAQYLSANSGWTLGTIFSATWNGDAIGYQYGGTGLTTLGTAGQVLTVNAGATALEWADGGSGAGTVVSTTPPPSPEEGMGWFDNETGKLFIYDGTFWVEANSSLNDEAVMDIVSTMIGDGTHSNIEITYSDLSNSLSFNVLSEPITDFITLNENITGTPTGNAGIIVNRGDLTDVAIRFNETEDQWEYTNDGAEYQSIGSGGGAVSTNTALSNSFWLGA
jgi:hypothetical protein